MPKFARNKSIFLRYFVIFFVFLLLNFLIFSPTKVFALNCSAICTDPDGGLTPLSESDPSCYHEFCDPKLQAKCTGDNTLGPIGYSGLQCDPPDPNRCDTKNDYHCGPGGCYNAPVCIDDPTTGYGGSWSACVAGCAAEDDEPEEPPNPEVGCPWNTTKDECECRTDDPTNEQTCNGHDDWVPRGCTYLSGSGTCCCNSSPPPPPPKYRCAGNRCGLDPANNQNGKYSGDRTCRNNCGVKCTLTRIDDTKTYSGSRDNNTGLCNGSGGTVNMIRNSTNSGLIKSSNPARYKINCTAEEFVASNNANRHWSIVDIRYGTNNTTVTNNAQIYNTTLPYIKTNQTAQIVNSPDITTPGANPNKRQVFYNFKIDYGIDNMAIPGISCEGSLRTVNLGHSVNGFVYDDYSYTCTKLNDNIAQPSSFHQNLLREAVVRTLNGPNYYATTIAKWGHFARNADGTIRSDTPQTEIVSDTFSTKAGTGCVGPCATDLFTSKISFRVKQTSTNVPNNLNGVYCYNMRKVSTIGGSSSYEIECYTENTAITNDQLADYPLMVVNASGYKPTDTNVIHSDPFYVASTGRYGYYDPRFIFLNNVYVTRPRSQGIYSLISTESNSGNSYSAEFEVWFKDEIPYGDKTISVTVTDGYTGNPSTGTGKIVQTIDTDIPEISRTTSVQTLNKFNMSSVATDDYALRNHYYYIGPAKFTLAPNNNPPETALYVSQSRKNQGTGFYEYLNTNQIKSITPVTPVGDFTTLNLSSTGYNGDAWYNGSFDNGTYTPPNFFWFKRPFTSSLVNPLLNTKTDTRTAQYELDLSKLMNQKEPFDLKFGTGDDNISNGGFGRWFAEDHFCNAQGENNSNTLQVGSPWLQSTRGNAFVKGPSDQSQKAINMSIYDITETTIDKDRANISTYMFQSTSPSSSVGPVNITANNKLRLSKSEFLSTSYIHSISDIPKFFNGADGAYNYVKSIVDKIVTSGDTSNPIMQNCAPSRSAIRIVDLSGNIVANQMLKGGTTATYDLLSGIANNTCLNGSGVNVIRINGSLTINKLPQPAVVSPSNGEAYNALTRGGQNINWPHYYVATDTIILVSGNVNINPDVRKDLDLNAKSLAIISGGDITIDTGTYKSYQRRNPASFPTDYPFYDKLDAFLIADGHIITKTDNPLTQGFPNAIVSDGLYIYGSMMQLNNTTLDGGGSADVICTLPNGQPQAGVADPGKNPCFGRDLILVHNFILAAETIQYDPVGEAIFSDVIGEINTIYNIREVKTITTK